jgi:hypothetical protein
MAEAHNKVLHLALHLQDLRIFKLDIAVLAAESEDSALIGAVKAVVLGNADYLEPLR